MEKVSREKQMFGLEGSQQGPQEKARRHYGRCHRRRAPLQGAELKSADIPSLRKDFGLDKDSLLGLAFCALKIL